MSRRKYTHRKLFETEIKEMRAAGLPLTLHPNSTAQILAFREMQNRPAHYSFDSLQLRKAYLGYRVFNMWMLKRNALL